MIKQARTGTTTVLVNGRGRTGRKSRLGKDDRKTKYNGPVCPDGRESGATLMKAKADKQAIGKSRP